MAALLFLAIWLPIQPEREHAPTSDLHTHLSVARHLLRGDGFVTDIAYPLSFAFPFARELPQPLIHRTPGFALWIVPSVALAKQDPQQALAAVRIQQILVLLAIVACGAAVLIRRGRIVDVGVWWLLLLGSPLLGYAVDWGFDELPCSLLLLLLWCEAAGSGSRDRSRGGWRGAVGPGLALGALLLMRPELFWVPLLWWAAQGSRRRRTYAAALLVGLLVAAPWGVRNLRLTGNPFFSLQSQAELVKDTRTWPEYSVYLQLEPQPMLESLRRDPVPILRKFARGTRYQVMNLHRILPAWFWLGAAVWLGRAAWHMWRRKSAGLDSSAPWYREPLPLLSVTLFGLIAEYSFFDIGLRHLAVLVPVAMLEGSAWTGTALLSLLRRWRPSVPATGSKAALGLAALALTGIGLLLLPARLPGWQQTINEARAARTSVQEELQRVLASDAPYFFTQTSVVPWLADRPAVWSPLNPDVEAQIRQYLDSKPPAEPADEPAR